MWVILKKIPASACRKKKIACSTNVIESLWEKKGKKYPAHQIVRKKFLMTRNHLPPPSRVKWSAPKRQVKEKLGHVVQIPVCRLT